MSPGTRRETTNGLHSFKSKTYPQISCIQIHKLHDSEQDMHTICIKHTDKKVTQNIIQITHLYFLDFSKYESMDSSCNNFIFLGIPSLFSISTSGNFKSSHKFPKYKRSNFNQFQFLPSIQLSIHRERL